MWYCVSRNGQHSYSQVLTNTSASAALKTQSPSTLPALAAIMRSAQAVVCRTSRFGRDVEQPIGVGDKCLGATWARSVLVQDNSCGTAPVHVTRAPWAGILLAGRLAAAI